MAIGNPHTNLRSARDGNPLSREGHYDHKVRRSELTNQARFANQVFIASVVEVNQQLGCYRIRVTGMADLIAVPVLYSGAGLAAGVRSVPMHGVGSKVLAMASGEMGVGQAVILGRIPDMIGESQPLGSSELTPGSPVGSTKDVISDEGVLNSIDRNYNNGHDIDVYPGDHQIKNILGCGLFVGALHASLTSGYGCSVECHYIDDLLRLNSFNFEHSTAGSESLMFADGGDYTEVRRLNPYVLETLGAPYQYGELPLDKGTPRGDDSAGSETGAYKFRVEEQQAWWRRLDFAGHLANLSSTYVSVPGLNSVRSSAKVDEQDESGVFRQHLDATGAYSVVSAKSIALVKDCLIPVPRERRRPDDSRGAKAETLPDDRAQVQPKLVDMQIQGIDEDQDGSALLHSAAASDSVAFRNHRSTVNFETRKDDWTIWDIEEVDLAGLRSHIDSSGMLPAADNVREGRMHAKLPKVALLRISEGQDARYYASRSMVLLNEDGSIHLQDGYGGVITMRAGSIDISCPGDITLRPGRTLAVIAGDTVSCVAGVDVELAANQGDVRIHADRNFSALSGNDGAGGILLETKAQGSVLAGQDDVSEPKFSNPLDNSNAYGGIWFKARGSSVCTVAGEIYSGNGSEASTIRMDCGESGVLTCAGQLNVFEASETLFLTDRDAPAAGTSMSIGQFGIYMRSRGSFFLEGQSLLAAGSGTGTMQFLVRGSAFFSDSLQTGSVSALTPQVGQLDSNSVGLFIKDVDSAISDRQQQFSDQAQAQAELGQEFDRSVIGFSGSSLSKLTFCYPDSALRGIPDDTTHVLVESDWQQQYRLQNAGSSMIFRGVDPEAEFGAASVGVTEALTYFWPGARALSSKLGQLDAESRFVDDKLRFKAEGFENPVAPLSTALTFEGNYVIPTRNQARSRQ